MSCKHQQYTATRLSGPFVFARLYKYHTSDLIQSVKDSLNPSGDEFKVLQEAILYPFLREMDASDHERLSLKSLDLIFSIFNAYFFRNNLPQDTEIVRKNDNDSSLTPQLSLPFKAAPSLRNFAATTRITHDPARKIDYNKPPYITLPFKGTSFTNSSPGDDVSALRSNNWSLSTMVQLPQTQLSEQDYHL
ncbi:hypothetical protein BPAE_0053g00310 [Botrytis paeoniae]|uniref:Uncharacterized protein n=1 Tax=Botrytis paeoniae TaxID=278948 RepID=A0A4Z1FYB6_9HELO|nr:hypothetical protein BPAE_0053g00310 [Botrytis paeoniae]